ncbi:MAG: phosphatase PAP2 family protein [Chloroflexi bacterium]|nr:phosphatase PAP2 family protein [Chloroflexota bacterium]
MTFNRILQLDAALSARLRVAEKPGTLRTCAAILAHSGDSWLWGAALGLVWWLGDAGWKFRAVVLLGAILGTAAVVAVLKIIFRRRRPAGEWGQIYRKTDPHSFPSGHAARAILLAMLGLFLGPPWFGALLALWGPLVALARVSMGVHYLSDVVAGALLGSGIGLFIRLSFLP